MPGLSTAQRTSRRRRESSGLARQRGAASLIVVMILFFVISMVAAYTNRSLIFEQRTSANQQRSSRALEAADAGLEWAIAQLNAGRITASCQISGNVADTSFRERYLVADAETGNLIPKKRSDGVTALYPTCVYDGTNWNCDCPSDAAPIFAVPAGNDIFPAFRVQFRRVCAVPTAPDNGIGACVNPVPTQPSVIHVDVNGCTAPIEGCLAFPAYPNNLPVPAVPGEGRATVHAVVALRSAIPAAPAAALTARLGLNSGAVLRVYNIEPASTGITIHSGGFVNAPAAELFGHAGTPGPSTLYPSDAQLGALTADRMFFNTFGMPRQTFRDQPAAIVVDCTGGCDAATVRAKASLNPGRVLVLDGNVDLDSAGDIGSAAQPVLLNVTGNLVFSSNLTVYGFVYSQGATWTMTGAGSIVGAAAAEGSFAGAATTEFVYSTPVLTRLRTLTGSFVRVPGSWKDFES